MKRLYARTVKLKAQEAWFLFETFFPKYHKPTTTPQTFFTHLYKLSLDPKQFYTPQDLHLQPPPSYKSVVPLPKAQPDPQIASELLNLSRSIIAQKFSISESQFNKYEKQIISNFGSFTGVQVAQAALIASQLKFQSVLDLVQKGILREDKRYEECGSAGYFNLLQAFERYSLVDHFVVDFIATGLINSLTSNVSYADGDLSFQQYCHVFVFLAAMEFKYHKTLAQLSDLFVRKMGDQDRQNREGEDDVAPHLLMMCVQSYIKLGIHGSNSGGVIIDQLLQRLNGHYRSQREPKSAAINGAKQIEYQEDYITKSNTLQVQGNLDLEIHSKMDLEIQSKELQKKAISIQDLVSFLTLLETVEFPNKETLLGIVHNYFKPSLIKDLTDSEIYQVTQCLILVRLFEDESINKDLEEVLAKRVLISTYTTSEFTMLVENLSLLENIDPAIFERFQEQMTYLSRYAKFYSNHLAQLLYIFVQKRTVKKWLLEASTLYFLIPKNLASLKPLSMYRLYMVLAETLHVNTQGGKLLDRLNQQMVYSRQNQGILDGTQFSNIMYQNAKYHMNDQNLNNRILELVLERVEDLSIQVVDRVLVACYMLSVQGVQIDVALKTRLGECLDPVLKQSKNHTMSAFMSLAKNGYRLNMLDNFWINYVEGILQQHSFAQLPLIQKIKLAQLLTKANLKSPIYMEGIRSSIEDEFQNKKIELQTIQKLFQQFMAHGYRNNQIINNLSVLLVRSEDALSLEINDLMKLLQFLFKYSVSDVLIMNELLSIIYRKCVDEKVVLNKYDTRFLKLMNSKKPLVYFKFVDGILALQNVQDL